MNFEFLKDLDGLSYLYENCSKAEKLAMTMPEQSVFTSRKSAELLAKFIYLAAHNQKMEDLSFVDLLSDPEVKRFFNSRNVMDAFHYIRKTGNRAAHTDSRERPEDAVAVLEDLHYVAGETARRLGLVKNYPEFNNDIGSFPNALFVNERDIEETAQKMYLEYVEKHDAQEEREKYLGEKDYDCLRYAIEGVVDMHEFLAFDHRPRSTDLIEYLQSYLHTLLRLSIERAPECDEEKLDYYYRSVALDARLIIGEQEYSSKDPYEFLRAVKEELPKADKFIIDSICSGNLKELYHDDPEMPDAKANMIRKDAAWTGSGMRDRLEAYKRRESFTYYYMSFLPNSGSFVAAAIDKGRSIQQDDLFDARINLSPDLEVECDGLGIFYDSESAANEFPEFIEAFKQLAREYVYEPNIRLCEDAWNPESPDYNPDCIIPYLQIKARTIGEYSAFISKLNRLAAQWKDRIELYTDNIDLDDYSYGAHNVLYNMQEMTLARIISLNGELRMVGSVLKRNICKKSSL